MISIWLSIVPIYSSVLWKLDKFILFHFLLIMDELVMDARLKKVLQNAGCKGFCRGSIGCRKGG